MKTHFPVCIVSITNHDKTHIKKASFLTLHFSPLAAFPVYSVFSVYCPRVKYSVGKRKVY